MLWWCNLRNKKEKVSILFLENKIKKLPLNCLIKVLSKLYSIMKIRKQLFWENIKFRLILPVNYLINVNSNDNWGIESRCRCLSESGLIWEMGKLVI